METKFLVIKNTYKGGDSFVVDKSDILDAIDSYDEITCSVEKENKQLIFMNDMLKRMADNLCSQNNKHHHDLLLASRVQQQFLPPNFIEDDSYEIAVYYKPLNGVSGDFYDYFFTANGKLLGIGLFDVAGHGVASALITMVAKQLLPKTFNFFNTLGEPLSETMHAYNLAFQIELNGFDQYMTGALVRFHENSIEIASAAHTDPYLKRGMEYVEKVNETYGAFKGPIIGIPEMIQKLKYASKNIPMHSNDTLLLYTDGLTESKNENNENYESYLPCDFLKQEGSAKDILQHIVTKFNSFMNKSMVKDDITIMVIRKK